MNSNTRILMLIILAIISSFINRTLATIAEKRVLRMSKEFQCKSGIMKSPLIIILLVFISACSNNDTRLPILGKAEVVGGETVYPKIKPFLFKDQDGKNVTLETFKDKIYVADFMFLSCPTICPKMTAELKKVYAEFEQNEKVLLLSHTIDPDHDSIPALKKYSETLKVKANKWHFVTGNKKAIYSHAIESYFSTTYEDDSAPGGYLHSGALLLIDTQKQIRGVYDGTDSNETKRLISDLKNLLVEEFKSKT
ncbi:SCO family protein [Pedobacter sp. GR22-6]|uniref:SCO family protein n=1 Tax=Pedobacter sp. GR22-6 TaxID=3127957 RepID=UPI00307D2ECB